MRSAPQAVAGSDSLVFFAPDIADASTITRAQGFLDHGFDLIVFGFRRHRYNRDYRPPWRYVLLGRTMDGRYLQRLWSLLAALPGLVRHRRHFRRAAIFYARNIDQLLLALLARALFRRGKPIAYEVLDIQPILVEGGFPAVVLRTIERLCLRSVRILVVSSPGFHRNYFSALQRYRGDWCLLENKLHPSAMVAVEPWRAAGLPRAKRPQGYRWVVGYLGLIRGQETFDLITRLAARLPDVLFKFRGVLTTVEPARFRAALRKHRNVVYEGDYENPRDLGALYSEIDFAWALDLEHRSHNSRWLLPCRFYEAGLFGVPCLAVRGFEVAARIEALDAGWTFDDPLEESLVRFFATVTPEDYAAKRQRLLELPVSEFIAGGDIAALCNILRERPEPLPDLGPAARRGSLTPARN